MIDEQEIIEEIIKETKDISFTHPDLYEYRFYSGAILLKKVYLIARNALQKGKELERDRQLLEGHEACNLAVVDKIGFIKEQASKIEELEKKLIEYQKRNRELGNKLFEIPGLECDCDGSGSEDGHELMCPFKPFQSVIDELRGEK